MILPLVLATVGACVLASAVILAACRAAAIGDEQLARAQSPPRPPARIDDALAALPVGLGRFAVVAADMLDVDVAAVLLGDPGGLRVAAVCGAPQMQDRVVTPEERLVAFAAGEQTGAVAAAELEGAHGCLVVARRDGARPLGGRDLELLGILADVAGAAARTPVTADLLDAVAGQVDVLAASLGAARTELRWRGGDFIGLVAAVGEAMDLSRPERAELEIGARVLDVGLLRVPVEMLERRGALRLAELIEVRRHAADGAEMLLGVPGLAGVSLLVRCHHERWDGRGYPHGLAGTRIPLGARILAACDVWWAITGDRPYAAAVDPDDAVVELRAVAGSQLDPDVVEALLGVLARTAPVLA